MGQVLNKLPFVIITCFSLSCATFCDMASIAFDFSGGGRCGIMEVDNHSIPCELNNPLAIESVEESIRVGDILGWRYPFEVINVVISFYTVDMVDLSFAHFSLNESLSNKPTHKPFITPSKCNTYIPVITFNNGESFPAPKQAFTIPIDDYSVETFNPTIIADHIFTLKTHNIFPIFHSNLQFRYADLYHGTHPLSTVKYRKAGQ